MSLDKEYAVGMSRAEEGLAESRIALAKHQAALELEQTLVRKFFEDLVSQLPMAAIEKHNIYRDGVHWSQLMFVHHGPPNKSDVKVTSPKLKEIAERAHELPTLTSIATINFETSQQQFLYADFMSNFERRLPLPPNGSSFPVIARYLGQSVRWWAMSEDDRKIQREVNKGFRETLRSLSPFGGDGEADTED